jgi:3,4-dihydroxy 2-butanone 4-phosphate synthase/GTP cyclohydrolase II
MNINTLLVELARGPFLTEFGDFTIAEFTDGKEHAIVLFKGMIEGQEDIICRIHSECVSTAFFYTECDCGLQMRNAEKDIQREGKGIIIYLQQEGRGNGSAAHIATLELKTQGIEQNRAYEMRGFSEDKRNFEMAGKILQYFKIQSVRLETNNNAKIRSLEKYGIKVKQEDYTNHVIELERIKNIEDYARAKLARPLIIKDKPDKGKWIFIIGDLNIDYKISLKENITGNQVLNKPEPSVGGTALNAAIEFKKIFEPIVFGKVGNDLEGRFIKDRLEQERIIALLGTATEKSTGTCTMLYHGNDRLLIKDDMGTNVNDYDLKNLDKALKIADINKIDYVFVVGHALTRCGTAHTKEMMDKVRATGAVIIFDLVPHTMYQTVPLVDLKFVVNNVEILIGEYKTFMGFLNDLTPKPIPSNDDIKKIFQSIPARIINIRFGEGNISHQLTCQRSDDGHLILVLQKSPTGYEKCPVEQRLGFGDMLTKELIDKYDDKGFPETPLETIPLA